MDYLALNSNTVLDRTLIPSIAEMQDRLAGSKVFSGLDLVDRFYNILIVEKVVHKTAFRCRYGHFEFLVCPFGLTNSPATLMKMMNGVFGDLHVWFIMAGVDDLLIYSWTFEEQLLHLEEVLK
jgi:hypothetical protein